MSGAREARRCRVLWADECGRMTTYLRRKELVLVENDSPIAAAMGKHRYKRHEVEVQPMAFGHLSRCQAAAEQQILVDMRREMQSLIGTIVDRSSISICRKICLAQYGFHAIIPVTILLWGSKYTPKTNI